MVKRNLDLHSSVYFCDMPEYSHKVIYIAHYPDSSPKIQDVYLLPFAVKLKRREIEEIILETERAQSREVFDIELLEYQITLV